MADLTGSPPRDVPGNFEGRRATIGEPSDASNQKIDANDVPAGCIDRRKLDRHPDHRIRRSGDWSHDDPMGLAVGTILNQSSP